MPAQTEVQDLAEALRQQPLGEPLAEALHVRLTKRHYAALQRTALIQQCELSSVVRLLLGEALAARGISTEL